jgi:putative ABC transport system permease protein
VGQTTAVINEAAARRLGYSDPRAAVGHILTYPTRRPSEIIGVVPDMPPSVRTATDPTLYYIYPKVSDVLSIKLTGHDIPETLKAIDRAWNRTGHPQPIKETFLSQYRLSLYRDLIVQSTTIAICAGLAVLIACLGLFALSAYTTERRTKEIGVRKAMGASTLDVVTLLLGQFSQPVLWANLIAWPAAWWAMNRWLGSFAYRVDLPIWLFVAAMVLAVVIALMTVFAHAWMAARAKPAGALRYE